MNKRSAADPLDSFFYGLRLVGIFSELALVKHVTPLQVVQRFVLLTSHVAD
jgi:hypothetical protein